MREVFAILVATTHFIHYTVLYYTVLYCTVLYSTVLYCTVLHCTVLYCTLYLPVREVFAILVATTHFIHYTVLLYYTVLYCTVLYSILTSEGGLCYISGHHTLHTLYCTVLYYTVLYCTVLYCTVLYCTLYLPLREVSAILVATTHFIHYTVLYYTVLYCTVLYSILTSEGGLCYISGHHTLPHSVRSLLEYLGLKIRGKLRVDGQDSQRRRVL